MTPAAATASRTLLVEDLGRREYAEIRELQKERAAERAAGRVPDTLLLVEHPPVYTRGTSARGPRPDLPHPLYDVERGGETTFHGPGQLVGYPIVHLRENGLTVGAYMRLIEGSLSDALSRLGLSTEAVKGRTGLWTAGGARKLASIGVAVRGWVGFHGFALNADLDLAPFSAILPCGFSPSVMSSVSQELGRRVGIGELKPLVANAFRARLEALS